MFEESTIGHVHTLYVAKEDGTRIEYVDSCSADLRLDIVVVKKGSGTTIYDRDEMGYSGLKNWQKEFDYYLARILIEKQMQSVTEKK